MPEKEELVIEIPYLPKSLNEILRMNKFLIRKYYRECKNDTMWLIKAEKNLPRKPFKKTKMIITFIFPDNLARDLDNYIGGAKGIIDGIRRAGLIEDDSWQKLEIEFRGMLGKKPSTVIYLKEMK